jgi:predicted TPR repeat methyltransferase
MNRGGGCGPVKADGADGPVISPHGVGQPPESAALHDKAGRACVEAGQLREALRHFQRANALDPDSAEALNGIAVVLYELGQVDDAVQLYKQILEIHPGDRLARINLGKIYAKRGRIVDALEQAEIVSHSSGDPDFPCSAVGQLLARCGAREAALVCFRTHLERHPEDEEGVALWMAALGGRPLPERASSRHLDRLYGARASGWDEKAKLELGYFGAELVATMLARLSSGPTKLDIVDLGCGTGMVGSLVAHKARHLIGVDLSAPMLERARAKQIYDHLEHGDLIEFMRQRPASCDAITCAATLIHFGDLRPPFEAAAVSLREQGLLVFTLFPNENENDVGVELDGFMQGGCFKHGRGYVRRLAQECGFMVEAIESGIHEYRKQDAVTGLVVGLRRMS